MADREEMVRWIVLSIQPKNWDCLVPVDYRLSHGLIFQHGILTKWKPTDLIDTGRTC